MKIKALEVLYLILGLIFIIYGFCIKAVGSGTLFFAVWLCGGIGFFLLALMVRLSLWKKIGKVFQKTILIFLALGIACFGSIEANIAGSFRAKGEANLDYVLILGAQVYRSGPSIVLKYRLNTAADYLKENPDTKCIVCGGKGYNEPDTEASVMAEYLENDGIDPDRIIIESNSTNTVDNIRNAMQLVDLSDQKVGIITNNFHVFRALRIADHNGLHAVGIAAPATTFYIPNNMLREFFGVIKDTLAGNMELF